MLRRHAGGLVTALLLAAIAVLLVLQVAGPGGGGTASPENATPQPWPVRSADAGGLRLGVVTPALARNGSARWRAEDLVEVNRFEQQARHHADRVAWFADWAQVPSFDAAQARAVAERGSVPEISWEPWDPRQGTRSPQPEYRLSRISGGAFDPYIERWAREIAAYGGPVRLRFAHEMNGRWYPWAESQNGNRPGDFARAWRHVHRIFERAGADNVTWIWSPVAGALDRSRETYPGDAYVDVIGLSGFNGGSEVFAKEWRSFERVYGPSLDYLHDLAPGRPVQVTEVASAEQGGDKARWIEEMFTALERRPWVEGLTWFDVDKEADWRIASSPRAQAAFAAGLSPAGG
jgi:hypothetical protein